MKTPLVGKIIGVVAAVTGISKLELLGPCRSARIVPARQLLMWLAVREYGHGIAPTARLLNRDHTTVIHALNVYPDRKARSPALQLWEARCLEILISAACCEGAMTGVDGHGHRAEFRAWCKAGDDAFCKDMLEAGYKMTVQALAGRQRVAA